ncbi:MAG TPA: carbamoyltransferase [Chryseolinea sp.]
MARIVILGISAFYHDSAAALVVNGTIVAAAQEERFTRKKHDAGFPINAIRYVLQEAGVDFNELTTIAFYDKPLLKFERLLETYHAFAPRGLVSFITALPVWMKEKLFMKDVLRRQLKTLGEANVPMQFPEHHLSHAASAFYPSPFEEAAILTIDGVGEWATTTLCYGQSNTIKILRELHFPHSVGLLYAAFTYYLGFKINSGEYKVMGLVPYGDTRSAQTEEFRQKILSTLVDVREDGSMLLNMDYFDFATQLTMTRDERWESLFGLPRRQPESEIQQTHMNLALALQQVTEEIVLMLARTVQQLTGSRNLVMAGGVALNCVANSKIQEAGIFDAIWIQPAAGDAGGALGAALAAFHIGHHQERTPIPGDAMQNAYLGPEYTDKEILNIAQKFNAPFRRFEKLTDLTAQVSERIAAGNIVGWFQGRMEFGPRALGNRSILGDPRNPVLQKMLNLKVKSREEFRPFAPSVLLEDLQDYFNATVPSPYMLFIATLRCELRQPEPEQYQELPLYDRLYHVRSDVPAVTHIDYSARIQTVTRESNPEFFQLLRDFKAITGCGMLINTSFNVRGEPIACTPQEAYAGFMRTGMDYLVMGRFLFDRREQPPLPSSLEQNFPLD